MAQRFSIGLRSGDSDGQFMSRLSRNPIEARWVFVPLVEDDGALSYI